MTQHYYHSNDNNQWRAIALSFAAGAASMSLWMYVSSRREDDDRKRRIRRSKKQQQQEIENNNDESTTKTAITTPSNNNNNKDDNNNRQQRQQQQQQQRGSSFYSTRVSADSTSFLDTVCQSVEDAVEDIKSRIGELPTRRTHWPWETIHKSRKQQQQQLPTTTKAEPDPTMKLTPDRRRGGPGNTTTNPELCIGSIFGLDVGGTLAKLVYFEQRHDHDMNIYRNVRERNYHQAASAQAVLMARRGGHQENLHHHHQQQQQQQQQPNQPDQQQQQQQQQQKPTITSRIKKTVSSHDSTINTTTTGSNRLRERSFEPGSVRRKLQTSSTNSLVTLSNNLLQQKAQSNTTTDHKNDDTKNSNTNTPNRKRINTSGGEIHTADSNDDLINLYSVRQESLPDDLNNYATTLHYNDDNNNNNQTTNPLLAAGMVDLNAITSSGEGAGATAAGGGGGGGMKKSRSMFDLSLTQQARDHAEALDRFYHFARKLDTYREGVRDAKLSFYSRALGGEFHFIRFETRRMENAIELIRANDLHLMVREMGATGGGAHKFAKEWDKLLGIQMKKQEELDSLVAGMQFVLSTVVGECYTFRPKKKSTTNNKKNNNNNNNTQQQEQSGGVGSSGGGEENANTTRTTTAISASSEQDGSQSQSTKAPRRNNNRSKSPSKSKSSKEGDTLRRNNKTTGSDYRRTKASSSSSSCSIDEEEKKSSSSGGGSNHSFSSSSSLVDDSDDSSETSEDDECRVGGTTDEWWWSRKVQRDSISYSSAYPYLLVTIGTGVSILRVDGPRKHERISGSTIGGGTYWGLIRLLTDLENFEDVMRLAEHGDPSKVDMLVGDIYGNNREALEKLGLPASLVASSFGKLVAREDPAAGLKQEDLARALLLMVTNNIGQVAYLNAQLHKTSRIYFVGNFLRGNKLSQRRLSFAINYWSKGEMEALFLEHEGYFGALGAFLLSQGISLDDLEQPSPSHRKSKSQRFGMPVVRSDSFRSSKRRKSQTLEEHQIMF